MRTSVGRVGSKLTVPMYRTALPDLRMEVEDQIADGDKGGTRWTAIGTHDGDLARPSGL